jgi:hypothetical protein
MLADLSGVAREVGAPIDGVVGMDVLGINTSSIDYRKKRIVFRASERSHHIIQQALALTSNDTFLGGVVDRSVQSWRTPNPA